MTPLDAPGASTRWFLRRGLASMAEGTTAYRSPSQRAAPALVLLFVVVMLTMVPGPAPTCRSPRHRQCRGRADLGGRQPGPPLPAVLGC
ncbi:MAG: hypothetical protein IPJ15_10270 [Actinomycetales bacterium]|nr:hypothetical protein [Candidatus Phosphoribacter baldrii]